MTVPFTPPEDSLLLSGLDDYPAAIAHLVDRGVENLTCISLPAIHDELLAEWCEAGGAFDAIDLIQLDDRDRGPSPEQPSLVRPVPLSRLHYLVEVVEAAPFASRADHTVVLLGIPALFDAVGSSRTRATVWSLLDALDGVSTVVLVTLSSTPDAVPPDSPTCSPTSRSRSALPTRHSPSSPSPASTRSRRIGSSSLSG